MVAAGFGGVDFCVVGADVGVVVGCGSAPGDDGAAGEDGSAGVVAGTATCRAGTRAGTTLPFRSLRGDCACTCGVTAIAVPPPTVAARGSTPPPLSAKPERRAHVGTVGVHFSSVVPKKKCYIQEIHVCVVIFRSV